MTQRQDLFALMVECSYGKKGEHIALGVHEEIAVLSNFLLRISITRFLSDCSLIKARIRYHKLSFHFSHVIAHFSQFQHLSQVFE